MTGLHAYLAAHLRDRYEVRAWDCSKFVLFWIARSAPGTAKLAAAKLVEAGYNEVAVGDEEGIKAVQAKFASTAAGLARYWADELPGRVVIPDAPAPGDIAVRADLACGIVDEDYQAVYLAAPRGYAKAGLRAADACFRVVG